MPYTRPYGSGGFKDSPDTSTAVTAAALNTMDVGIANAHTDIANTLATIPSRNRIINGAMMVDQRRAGAARTGYNGISEYVVDRFYVYTAFDGQATMQQVADGPPGASGYSGKITVTTIDATLGTSQGFLYGQKIEGYNVADFGFGTANPQAMTLSFYVKSSLTGTFSVIFRNAGAYNRTYAATYTISAANTWERKTITLTADASGTWASGTNAGLEIHWSLGGGPDVTTSTVGSWQAGNYWAASGQVNVLATLNATFQLSGVQLEYGTAATRFEHRSYDDELRRCMRYYQQFEFASGVGVPGFVDGSSTTVMVGSFPVDMRTSPVITSSGSFEIRRGGVASTAVSSFTYNASTRLFRLNVSTSTANLTTGQGVIFTYASGSPVLMASAEL